MYKRQLPGTINGSPVTGALSFSEGDVLTLSVDAAGSGLTSATIEQTAGTQIDFGAFQQGGFIGGNNLTLPNADFMLLVNDVEGNRAASIATSDGPILLDIPLPAVNADMPFEFNVTLTDGTQTVNETITFTVTDDPSSTVVTLSGTANAMSGAQIIVSDATDPLVRSSDVVAIAETTTDANGAYTLTFDTASISGDILDVRAFLENASLVCPATSGCGPNIAFGDSFTVIDGVADLDVGDGSGVQPFDATISAIINTPAGGSANLVNINELTQLTSLRIIAAAIADNSTNAMGQFLLRSQDVAPAQSYVANIFDLNFTDFTQLNFVDITQNITSTNEDDILASVIGAGIFESAAQIGQVNLQDFAELFVGSQIPFLGFPAARFTQGVVTDFPTTLETLVDGALLVIATSGSTNASNVMTLSTAQSALETTSDLIDAATPNVGILPNGDLP